MCCRVFWRFKPFLHSHISNIPTAKHSSSFISHASSSIFYHHLDLVVDVTDAACVNKLNLNPLQWSYLSDVQESKTVTSEQAMNRIDSNGTNLSEVGVFFVQDEEHVRDDSVRMLPPIV